MQEVKRVQAYWVDRGAVMPSPNPQKYEPHITGHVKPDGQIYVGRKHAGKKAEVWFLREDDEGEVKE